jgi:acyl-coenzyme A thioesterase PaaI-like protein
MIAIQTAQDFLKDNFAQWILDMGIAVTEMSDDGATLEIPITPHIERVGGIVCGQALSSLADTCHGLCLLFLRWMASNPLRPPI